LATGILSFFNVASAAGADVAGRATVSVVVVVEVSLVFFFTSFPIF
jgi:hypothetical protein